MLRITSRATEHLLRVRRQTDGRAMLVVRRGDAGRGGAVAGAANRANATG